MWNNFYSNNFGSKTQSFDASSLNDFFKNWFIQWTKQPQFAYKEAPKYRIGQDSIETSSPENVTKNQTSSIDFVTLPTTKVPSSTSKPSSTTFKSLTINLLKRQEQFNLQTTKKLILSVKRPSELIDGKNELMKHPSCVNGEFKKDLNNEKLYFRCDNGEFNKFECQGKSFWFHDVLSCVIKEQETVFRCDQQHIYPDLTNCKNYHRCEHSRFINFQCPDDLVWNQKLLTCDSPDNVIWCSKGKPEILYNYKMANGSCNKINDYKHDIKSCDRFYRCTNYQWTAAQCPPDSIWIKHLNRCDLTFNGPCDDKYSVSDPMKNAFDMLSIVVNHNLPDQTILRIKNVCRNFLVKLQEERERNIDDDEDSEY